MTKAKNNFVFGAIVLVICNLCAKLLGAIYRIPLLKILGSEGLGMYQMIFPIYSLLLVVSSSGIVVALSKFIARETLHHNNKNSKMFLFSGILISTLLSIIFSILILFFIPKISSYQGNANLKYCYYIILPSLLISSLIATFRGYFLGKNEMLFSGGTQILEQVFKLIFSLFFATKYAQNGIIFAVCGAVLGVTISEIIAFIFCIIIFIVSKKGLQTKPANKICKYNKYVLLRYSPLKILYPKDRYISFKKATKQLLMFGLNVTFEACIIPLISAIDSLIVVPLLVKCGMTSQIAYKLFGLEDGIVASLVAMPIIVASGIGSSIIPNIRGAGSDQVTSKNVNSSIKIVWLVSTACAFAFIFFAKEIVSLIYAGGLKNISIDELKIAQDLLKLNAFNVIYLSLLTLSNSILQGLGNSFEPVKNLGISAIIRLCVLLITLPQKNINIYGTALADMSFYAMAFIFNILAIKKLVNVSFNLFKVFAIPIGAGGCMCIVMKSLQTALNGLLTSRILTTLIIFVGGVSYLSILFASHTLNFVEIKNVFKRKQHI